MNECQPISDDEPIRQGDVFVSHPVERGEQTLHVVITADCDLAQGKTGAEVMCLPVIDAGAFVRETWTEDRWMALTGRLHQEIATLVNAAHLGSRSDALALSEQFIVDWFERDGMTGIASALPIDDATRSRLAALHRALEQVRAAPATMAFADRVNLYYDLHSDLGLSNSVTKAAKRINELRSILTVPRQDTLFISSIPGQDRLGWVVQLRRMASLPLGSLMRDRQSWFDDRLAHLRLGRLGPAYKYALAQQFGQMFARIGLPAEYAGWKELVVGDVCAGLYPGETPSRR